MKIPIVTLILFINIIYCKGQNADTSKVKMCVEYDCLSQRIESISLFDKNNRIVKSASIDNGNIGITSVYYYDSKLNVIKIESYDAENHLIGVVDAKYNSSDTAYLIETDPPEIDCNRSDGTVKCSFDSNGRLIERIIVQKRHFVLFRISDKITYWKKYFYLKSTIHSSFW